MMLRLFSVVLPVAVGGVIIYSAMPGVDEASRSADWPSTQGTVVVSEVVGTYGDTVRRKGNAWKAHVEYRYEVDGKRYTSSRISFSDYGSSIKSSHEERAGRYPAGREIQVFYDPKDPGKAVLEIGAPVVDYLTIAFGAVFVGIGGFMFFVFRLVERKKKEKLVPDARTD